LEQSKAMSADRGPSPTVFRWVDALYAALAADVAFARVRRLMEFDWSVSDLTVEALGLVRLLQNEARKLDTMFTDQGAGEVTWSDVADAIRYTERHDALAQDALWWLSHLATDPLLRGRSGPL